MESVRVNDARAVWTLGAELLHPAVANSAQVVLIPLLAGGLWWITARAQYIDPTYRNRWWENLVMLVLFALAIWGAFGAVRSVAGIVFANA